MESSLDWSVSSLPLWNWILSVRRDFCSTFSRPHFPTPARHAIVSALRRWRLLQSVSGKRCLIEVWAWADWCMLYLCAYLSLFHFNSLLKTGSKRMTLDGCKLPLHADTVPQLVHSEVEGYVCLMDCAAFRSGKDIQAQNAERRQWGSHPPHKQVTSNCTNCILSRDYSRVIAFLGVTFRNNFIPLRHRMLAVVTRCNFLYGVWPARLGTMLL